MHPAVYLLLGAYTLGIILFYLNAREMRNYCGLNPTYSNLICWKRWYAAKGREEPEWLEKRFELLRRSQGK
jgi:hypothetical protein